MSCSALSPVLCYTIHIPHHIVMKAGQFIPPEAHFVSLFFRVVKEEISDDSAKLPCFNGRVVSWVRDSKSVSSEWEWECE